MIESRYKLSRSMERELVMLVGSGRSGRNRYSSARDAISVGTVIECVDCQPQCMNGKYADREQICQQVGWNQKGHKEDCKILKDKDIQGMLAMDWDRFDGHFWSFPLN